MDFEPIILNKVNKVNSFKDRLIYACNKNAKIPEYGQGQQVVIAKAMKVSQEAVRKWFVGTSKPRPNAMKALSAFLDVPYVWLSLGVDHTETAVFRDMSLKQDACLYAFVSYILGSGGSIAFNKGANDTSDVTVIKDGEIKKYSVYAAIKVTGSGQIFKLTSNTENVESVCAVKYDSFDVAYEFVHVPFEIAAEYAKSGKDYIINNLQNLKYKEK